MKRYFFLILLGAAFLLTGNANAVTVGPVKLELAADPGDIIRGNLFVKNDEPEQKTFYSSFESFTEPAGTKIFSKSKVGLPTWIKVDSAVTLAAGQGRDIPFTIEVSENAPAGSHSAVIWWSTAPPSEKSQLSVVARAGILVYLRVSGEVKEEGYVSAFTGGLENLKIIFKNTGNSYLEPHGTVSLKNIFGFEQAVFDVNKYGTVVLNESEKELPLELTRKSGFFFGPYRALATVAYGTENKNASASRWLFIFPVKTILIVVVSLAVLIFIFTKGIRRYNRWIIKKAQS